jgi:hypothetical protein
MTQHASPGPVAILGLLVYEETRGQMSERSIRRRPVAITNLLETLHLLEPTDGIHASPRERPRQPKQRRGEATAPRRRRVRQQPSTKCAPRMDLRHPLLPGRSMRGNAQRRHSERVRQTGHPAISQVHPHTGMNRQ